jgi:tetratricopeptide (TPR) repeat protein
MKKLLFACTILFAATMASAQVKMPAPSSTQTIKQDFALGNIELTYSRPSIKGRKIFGDLVPFDAVWRTGANGATIVKFNDAVEIAGKKIDTGSYALYTIPNATSWEVILNKGTSNWGTNGYKETDDVVRFKVAPKTMATSVETFSMQFANILPESCELHIMWDKTAIAIPIKALIKDRLRASIEKALTGEKKPYWQAAQFYNEYDKNNEKALANITSAVEANPKAYWMFLYKAKIELAMGNKKAAMESSKKSLELAKTDDNQDYVKMNEDLMKKLK